MRVITSLILLVLALMAESTPPNLQISASGPAEGTCSAALQDGRSFITGGSDSHGPLVTAQFFEKKGQLTAAAPMLTARRDHICIALDATTILVAGGDTGQTGSTNATEIFHTDTNTWTPTGPMLTARRGASVVLLKSGMALIVGGRVEGRVANTLEIYDPAAGRFEQALGVLAGARIGYALAALEDGRVIIAGGFEGERALDTIDVFDPALGVLYAGRMSSPRAHFTGTALTNGQVLFVGGTDGARELASAELFDLASGDTVQTEPLSAPRRDHIAVQPRDSDRVLIAGGMANGKAVESAEFYVADRNAFESAAEASSSEAQVRTITIASLNRDATLRRVKIYSIPR